MMKWSELQKLYPFFWMWLTAWLKNKGAYAIEVHRGLSNSEYVKVRFNIPLKEQDLTDVMLCEMLEEAGIRIEIDFDNEGVAEANWRYVMHRNRFTGFWTQIHSSGYVYKERKYAVWNSFNHAIHQVNESLKKENAVEQY